MPAYVLSRLCLQCYKRLSWAMSLVASICQYTYPITFLGTIHHLLTFRLYRRTCDGTSIVPNGPGYPSVLG